MDPELYPGQLLVTTASQIPLQALEDRVPCRAAKLIPSIAQEIGAGAALLMYGSRVIADDRKLIDDLLGRISHPIDRRVIVSDVFGQRCKGQGCPPDSSVLFQRHRESSTPSNETASSSTLFDLGDLQAERQELHH